MTGINEMQKSDELDEFYTEEDPWSYDKNEGDQQRLDHLLACLPRSPFQRTLDIGCGNGFVTNHLPGRRVIGVDLSPKAIGWARQRSLRLGRQIDYRVGSIFDVAKTAGNLRFDLIVVTGVLYEQYIGKAMSLVNLQIDKILQENGYIALVHIADWYTSSIPYRLIDRTTYQYRSYTHLLEVYRK